MIKIHARALSIGLLLLNSLSSCANVKQEMVRNRRYKPTCLEKTKQCFRNSPKTMACLTAVAATPFLALGAGLYSVYSFLASSKLSNATGFNGTNLTVTGFNGTNLTVPFLNTSLLSSNVSVSSSNAGGDLLAYHASKPNASDASAVSNVTGLVVTSVTGSSLSVSDISNVTDSAGSSGSGISETTEAGLSGLGISNTTILGSSSSGISETTTAGSSGSDISETTTLGSSSSGISETTTAGSSALIVS